MEVPPLAPAAPTADVPPLVSRGTRGDGAMKALTPAATRGTAAPAAVPKAAAWRIAGGIGGRPRSTQRVSPETASSWSQHTTSCGEAGENGGETRAHTRQTTASARAVRGSQRRQSGAAPAISGVSVLKITASSTAVTSSPISPSPR